MLLYLVLMHKQCLELDWTCSRVFFNGVSKLISDWFGFAQPRGVIGPESSRHLLNQSDSKLERIVIWSLAFSRLLFSMTTTITMLNYKITIIGKLQYSKGFLALVSEKGMEILYYFKSFNANYKKRAGWLLLTPSWWSYLKGWVWSRSSCEFGHVLLVSLVTFS